jgi:tetratricopeptide (TPR) repeat protein
MVYNNLGEYSKAIESYEKALEIRKKMSAEFFQKASDALGKA